MDASLRNLIAAIHDSGYRGVLAVTGGGTGAAALLLAVPGGSRSILEIIVPYDERSLAEFLGQHPTSFCSPETAQAMSRRALERARWLAPGTPVAGIACTASLRSDRPKHGDHRFHLAIQTDQHDWIASLTLTKEARTREEEEDVLDRVLLNAMAEALHLNERGEVALLPGEAVQQKMLVREDSLTALLQGRIRAAYVASDGRISRANSQPQLLLPGSFNPLHAGHRALAETASRLTGLPAAFELSILNADKPPLTGEEVRRRLAAFTWYAPLWLTRAPTFVEKAELFPRVTFVVGADTAERIVQPRFYGGSEQQLDRAMTELRSRGCRFLAAGRVNSAGDFVDLDCLTIPSAYRDLFTPISAGDFRVDLCSTQFRACREIS